MKELGEDNLLPEEKIESLFSVDTLDDYFSIVSLLFYVEGYPSYSVVRKKLIKKIKNIVSKDNSILVSAESCHLFLDALSCPHIPNEDKALLISIAAKHCQISEPVSGDLLSVFSYFNENSWFVDWKEVDLYNSLEKKRLNKVY
jgi:hypothetical protein